MKEPGLHYGPDQFPRASASTALGWGNPKHQGMNKATVLVKHWLFSLACNKAHFVTFTHLCSSHMFDPFWVQTFFNAITMFIRLHQLT